MDEQMPYNDERQETPRRWLERQVLEALSEQALTRKWASCRANWMKLSEETRQHLMKLLPKWEKGKTWQSMLPDKVLAPLRAREMDEWICQRGRWEK